MIFSQQQEEYINDLIQKFSKNIPFYFVIREEERKYINTEYESMMISIGHGDFNKHLQDSSYDSECELVHYYSKTHQLAYVINVFRLNKTDLRVVVYNCVYGTLNGSTRVLDVTLGSVDKKEV